MFYIIMGPPGSGKGTQSQRLSNKLGLPHISSGDLLRFAIKANSTLGMEAQEYINKGELVPDVLVWNIIREKLDAPECLSGCIIDGFPRTLDQVIWLNNFLSQRNDHYRVIQLDVSKEEVVRRISSRFVCPLCGYISCQQGVRICPRCHVPLIRRSDDTPEIILQRLENYKKSTEPLIHYYQDLGKLVRISAESSPDEVFQSILTYTEV
ncbi:adenylate kinase [Chlamydia avium]|nr:adenylate kinase [Chlamydia avium]EPP36419.1 adenylate kinase family protein [Chlamydia psittaci 10_743_SC13]